MSLKQQKQDEQYIRSLLQLRQLSESPLMLFMLYLKRGIWRNSIPLLAAFLFFIASHHDYPTVAWTVVGVAIGTMVSEIFWVGSMLKWRATYAAVIDWPKVDAHIAALDKNLIKEKEASPDKT